MGLMAKELLIVLESDHPPGGRIEGSAGVTGFTGWIELLSALDQALRAPALAPRDERTDA
jgi:hypothetical protein